MNRLGTIIALSGFLLTSDTFAAVEDNAPRETELLKDSSNGYRTIVDRNPFGLKPPPPPPPPQAVAPPPKNDIKLTGITSFGVRKAYFMATESRSNKVDYYSLAVDEKRDGLEVLAIDEVAKSVKIRNGGIETLLTFATHGVTAPNAPAPANPAIPAPGAPPGAPGGFPGIPTAGNAGNSAAPVVTPASLAARGASITPMRTIPSRTPRVQSEMTAGGFSAEIAQRYGLGQPASTPDRPAAPQSNLSSEEQVLFMELQRVANPQLNLPPTPGLPSTEIVPVPGAGPQPFPGIPVPTAPPPGLPGRR